MTMEGSLDDQNFYCGSRWRQYYSTFAASLAVANIGTAWSWSATALPDFNVNNSATPLTTSEESWITAVPYIAAMFACPLAGFLMEKLGVKASMLMFTFPLIGGWVLITLATNFWMIFAGRFITGFCAGGAAVAVPVFVAETTEVQIRGTLGIGFDFFGSIGQLYIFFIGSYVSWRWQAVACGIVPIIFQLLLLPVPESPRTLISQGKLELAQNSLAWFRSAPNSALIQPEFETMVNGLRAADTPKRLTLSEYMAPAILRPTVMCVMIMFFMQMCGVIPLFSYTVKIFETAGFHDSYLATIIVGLTQVVATFVPAFLVDQVGRRVLLMTSAMMMFLSLTILGAYMYWQVEFATWNWIPLVCLVACTTGFSIGFGPISFVLVGELVPTAAKGFCSAVILIATRFMAFAVVFLFNDLIDLLGNHGCYWLYAGSCLASYCYVYLYVPETKGKSLEDIQLYFKS